MPDERLLDPDCRAGKHASCVGGPCECDCHRPIWGESTAATPDDERRRRAFRELTPDYLAAKAAITRKDET